MAENRLTVPTNPARALRELNRKPVVPSNAVADELEPEISKPEKLEPEKLQIEPVENDTNKQTNNNTILQYDKPTDIQTNTQTYQPTNNQTDQQTNKLPNKQTDKLTNRRTNKAPTKAVQQKLAEPQIIEEPAPRPARIDGRTLRVRQDTADRTMVTSFRLAVTIVDALDEYCYKHRQRKQDVVQAALDMYFAEMEEAE